MIFEMAASFQKTRAVPTKVPNIVIPAKVFQKTCAVPTKVPSIVIPAKAGIHLRRQQNMDSR
jgi:hypothetical protein